MQYTEYKALNLSNIGKEMEEYWQKLDIFEQCLKLREGQEPFVFYEGPPSANGTPGIHHVMARTIKDMICRYQTMKGKYVGRKGGWDTHGLPVELGVEKSLGITKEDIGKTITVEEYNNACRQEVMKYKDLWDQITKRMGYWVDLENPYITFDNKYIESVWHLLSQLYNKDLLYKGYTIQPYSPAAGTGLSSHELNLPGCYRDVKDTTVVAQFKIKTTQTKVTTCPWGFKGEFHIPDNLYFLAWTTTPWTLPSNTALAVGNNIDYVLVRTFNPYLGDPISVILAKNLLGNYFPEKNSGLSFEEYQPGNKDIPFQVLAETKGSQLVGLEYEQLIDYVRPDGDAFRVIAGDYVTTEDGTGIVHIAPTFGADDKRVAHESGIAPLLLLDKQGISQPMVDKTGKFFKIEDLDDDYVKKFVNVPLYTTVAGRYVKPDYEKENEKAPESLDVYISLWLKQQKKAFKIEKYTHNYPHCWRTDKPILYYPLDSWFVKTTQYKERMMELNNTIKWKPQATGTGRFGNWLENLVDWNLSRSRFWGVPLPIWISEDKKELLCIGSIAQLMEEIEKSVAAGFMKENPYKAFVPGDFSKENYLTIDIHRPYVDDIVLVSPTGQKMNREPDLIDVWFDSGAMPYCQWHYPFENKEIFDKNFPADFIAEGVDQTRGWFFTLHAIATMLFDSVAFKNVISNGLVLDKAGNKMSKRHGNAVDPFDTIEKYGPDATRWYMMTNAQPWDNLKFDVEGIVEVQRKFFGTLYNTYNFFALYANIDGFEYKEADIDIEKRPEIDRWILSELNSLIKRCDENYSDFEPTKVGRDIQQFVDEYLSNWYVRLCRRRFWKGEYNEDKISAFQTLYTCMTTIAKLAAPIAPFFMDKLFLDLNKVTKKEEVISIHLAEYPVYNPQWIDKSLEERMQLAQQICSMALSLRKRNNLKVRQPLGKIMIPVMETNAFRDQITQVKELILHEINVKGLEFVDDSNGILTKRIKPDFKKLGPKYGKIMKSIAARIQEMTAQEIAMLEKSGTIAFTIEQQPVEIELADVEIFAEDIPGWVVANQGALTVALDITLTEPLLQEGIARELVNRIQNYRKDSQLEVVDYIRITVQSHPELDAAFNAFESYIKTETLCRNFQIVNNIENTDKAIFDITDQISIEVSITKVP
ncbi:MAG: isoleucine--tRNA ligase [Bacteroidales bacterium]|jgi:isoleucyl-tRNA synthetase|nr:isoleucine--tRNA ligase [Bacteroidales bacterium]